MTTEQAAALSDLRIFWGPEISRLEYLLHLIDTGRIIDDRQDAEPKKDDA